MKKKKACVIVLSIIMVGSIILNIVMGISIFSLYLCTEKYNKAVSTNELSGDYIICKYISSTLTDWEVIKKSDGTVDVEECSIIFEENQFNPTSFCRLDFLVNNTFVFYITDRQERDIYGELVVEYTISDWTVLTPVFHENLLDLFIFRNHIVNRDFASVFSKAKG